eukprot:11108667-Alexandrium_andersonii.AAC.1
MFRFWSASVARAPGVPGSDERLQLAESVLRRAVCCASDGVARPGGAVPPTPVLCGFGGR